MRYGTHQKALEITDLLAHAVSSEEAQQIANQLTDHRQRYVAIVREQVARGDADNLAALRDGSSAVHRMLHDTATHLTRTSDLAGEPFRSDDIAPIHAARALAALGLTLLAAPAQQDAHLRVFRRWSAHAGFEVPAETVRELPHLTGTPHAAVIRRLAAVGDLDPLSLVWVAYLDGWTRDWPDARRFRTSTQVLLDRGRQGQMAVLSLSLIPGLPAALVPDPAVMTLSSADVTFNSSLRTAWKAAGSSSRGVVLWSLSDKEGPVTRVTGESLSLAFAVLLDEQRRLSTPLRGPLTVRRLRPRTALVGRIDPDAPSAASSVSGYDAKLSAVDENTRVVLPQADYRVAAEANHKYGDNAQLVPVKTWRQAAKAGRALDRRRLLAITAVVLLVLTSTTFGLYRESESRRTASARTAAADAAARVLLGRTTDNQWERLHLDVRAYRTRDGLDARTRIRAWARQLRFADLIVPTGRQDAVSVVNRDGSAAVTSAPTNPSQVLAWDLTSSPPRMLTVTVNGVGSVAATWLGPDVVALSRPRGKTSLWNVRTQSLVREFQEGGDVLVSDPRGRWLGYGSAGTKSFKAVDLARNTTSTFHLPDQLQRWGPRTTIFEPLVVIEGMLTTGELIMAHRENVFALSTTGYRPVDRRAHLAQVTDLGFGQAVVETCANGRYEIYGLETNSVLATDRTSNACTSQFVAGGRHLVSMEEKGEPRSRPEPESYVVLGVDTDSTRARRIEIPAEHKLVRASIDSRGTYRIVLDSVDSLLFLRVPPPDPMENALIHSADAMVSPNTRYLVLRHQDNHVETWDTSTRRLIATTPPGAAEFSQAGAAASLVISPNSNMIVTVHHNSPAKLWHLPDLQPFGEIPPPLAAATPHNNAESEEVSAVVSFATDQLLLVTYGDRVSTWSVTPLTKLTEARVSLPEPDAPGLWRIILAKQGQLLTVQGSHVQRNRVSDGMLVPGSNFTLEGQKSRDFQNFQPAVDPSESFLAVFHEDAIEIWNLTEHKRVDRLELPDYTAVDYIQFGDDAHEVDFVTKDYRSKNPIGIFTQRWNRSGGIDIRGWLGFGKTGVDPRLDDLTPGVLAWAGADGGLETATPLAWLNRICDALPALQYEDEPGLPDAAWHGPVCANR